MGDLKRDFKEIAMLIVDFMLISAAACGGGWCIMGAFGGFWLAKYVIGPFIAIAVFIKAMSARHELKEYKAAEKSRKETDDFYFRLSKEWEAECERLKKQIAEIENRRA